MNRFGDRLRKARTEKNLTQEQLAELCETSAGTIRNIEKSRRMPSYELLALFSNTLKVSPEYLMQDDLTFDLNGTEKEEIIRLINKYTPSQLSFLKDLLKTAEKHLSENRMG